MRNPRPLPLLASLLFVACASGTGSMPSAGDADAGDSPPAVTEPSPAPEPPAPEPPVQTAEASPASQYAEDPVAQKRGSDLFRALCTGYCHSTNAGEDTDASYLFDCDWTHGGSDQEIHTVISDGVPETRMQGFGGKLPEEDLWKIVSFLRQKSECPS